ncbi:hypothetical protein ACIBU0_43535 [Streptomyces sp. NPDC049627]|uniref:hypothetical protein n=1 Tax=Streptomyces sp. NPDC049627 TaxID=3365595 RepID=UPI00379B62A4
MAELREAGREGAFGAELEGGAQGVADGRADDCAEGAVRSRVIAMGPLMVWYQVIDYRKRVCIQRVTWLG